MSDGKLIFETGIDTKGIEKDIKGIKNITVSVDGTMDVSQLKKKAKSVSLPEIEVSVDLTEADRAMEELDSGGGKLKEFATGVLKKNVEKLTQGGVIGVVQSVAASVTDAAKAGDEVDKTSKKLNMSRKGYQEWGYVLERNGASAKSLQSGMAGLNGVVEKARSGNADAAKQFEKLGIEVGKLDEMSGEELFEAAVAGLQGMDDEGEKAALATALFGDSAVELIPTLSQTAEETAALKQEAQDLGAVMSDDMVDSSVALNEHVEAMSTAWQGLATQLATIVMPLFTGLFEGVTAVISGVNTLFSGPQKSELETAVDNIEQDFNDFNSTVDAAEQNYNDTAANIATRKDLADKYLAVLDELGKKEVLTDEDTEAIKNATIALTNLYPDLKDDIDAETGLFKSNTQAIRDNIQAINDHAMAKAAQTLSAQFDEQRIVAASNLVEATTTVRIAEEEYDAAFTLTGGELAAAKIALLCICSLRDRQCKQKPSFM